MACSRPSGLGGFDLGLGDTDADGARFESGEVCEVAALAAVQVWLRGTNIADDGALDNHTILHPLYMVDFDQGLYEGFVYGLADRSALRAALHNITHVYSALVDEPFTAPDGTVKAIYQPGSGRIHDPGGNDWGTHVPFHFGNFDLLLTLTAQDTGIDPAADTWERLHNEEHSSLMARFTDGRTYGASGENTYYGREHRIGAMAGQAFLTLFVARNTTKNRLRFAWKCMRVAGADSRKV